ncbi:MAG: secondary thiamine-phosphate synthase enzyme YjbQ [bacterium]
MRLFTDTISLKTNGNAEIHDITAQAQQLIHEHGLKEGQITLFVSGSTGALTTMEFEPGQIKDMAELFERLIPSGQDYHHNATWEDGNGHSHLRASLLGPSLVIPFRDRKLLLGTWQQIVFVDFDNRPRKRSIIVQGIGE